MYKDTVIDQLLDMFERSPKAVSVMRDVISRDIVKIDLSGLDQDSTQNLLDVTLKELIFSLGVLHCVGFRDEEKLRDHLVETMKGMIEYLEEEEADDISAEENTEDDENQ